MNHKPDYCLLASVVADIGSQPAHMSGVSAVTFDNSEELLWVGNSSGHVTSFFNNFSNYNNLEKYTSFHVDNINDIRDVLTCPAGVLSLTKSSLRMSIRRGLTAFNHKSELLKDMQCMTQLPSGLVLMGGHQDKMIELDIERVKHVRVTDISDSGCVVMRQNARFLCHGDANGKITLRDPNLLHVQQVFQTHSSLSDFDVHGNYLITCGYSERNGSYLSDQFLMVYDLRILKSVAPVSLPNFAPYLLRFIPLYASKFCVVSQTGSFQLVDITETLTVPRFIYNVDLPPNALITSFGVSSSSQALTFGDNQNYVYLYGASDEVTFNMNSQQTEFADPIEPSQQIPITDRWTPLSEMHMFNYYGIGDVRLLSDLPPEICQRSYRPLPPIDPQILNSMKMVGTIGYAPNVGKKLTLSGNLASRSAGNSNSRKNSPDVDVMPHRYQLLEPNYNKMDKDEYDFSRYNHSPFTGLDSSLPNSYSNNIIQSLYFIAPLRSTIIGHLCKKEFCLTCELGFLFQMLMIAPKHVPCQASNFLRAFRTISQAIQFKLIFPEDEGIKKQISYTQKSQQWLRFILHQIHNDTLKSCNEDKISKEEATIKEESLDVEKIEAVQKDENEEKIIEEENIGEKEEILDENEKDNDKKETSEKVEENEKSQEVNLKSEILEKEESEEEAKECLKEIKKEEICKDEDDSCFNSDDNGNSKKSEEAKKKVSLSIISELFELSVVRCFKCNKCDNRWESAHSSFPITLMYPTVDNTRNITFLDLLKHSILPEQTTAIHCENCSKSQPVTQTSQAKCIPDVLAINCGLDNDNAIKFWKKQIVSVAYNQQSAGDYYEICETKNSFPEMPNQKKPCRYGNKCNRSDCKFLHERDKLLAAEKDKKIESSSWIPLSFSAKILDDGKLEFSNCTNEDNFIEYQLINVTSVVKNKNSTGNIVSAIKVDPIYSQDKSSGDETNEWYLFNHFSINPITREEVVHLDLDWKLPSIIVYGRKDLNQKHSDLLEIKHPITSEVFLEDINLALRARRGSISFTPLEEEDMPKKGDLVAMDAEFVTLNQQETEIRGDGTHNTVKPSQKSVARISCVRGCGPLEGQPFIDDYIATQEQVADYLTKFSGIQPGDLDVAVSSKHLTTLKSTYLKLRFLIDTGCIFVGHGLKNDFRVINLVVPPEQVIDTVHLFQSQNVKRMVSLKFLAWHFLSGLKIQSVTHDSVEDAKTALQLYRKYLELDQLKCMDEAIEELYKIGRELAWQVPGTDSIN